MHLSKPRLLWLARKLRLWLAVFALLKVRGDGSRLILMTNFENNGRHLLLTPWGGSFPRPPLLSPSSLLSIITPLRRSLSSSSPLLASSNYWWSFTATLWLQPELQLFLWLPSIRGLSFTMTSRWILLSEFCWGLTSVPIKIKITANSCCACGQVGGLSLGFIALFARTQRKGFNMFLKMVTYSTPFCPNSHVHTVADKRCFA